MDLIATFDLEIAKEIPEGEKDWKKHRPLGITCAAIATPQGVWTYAAKDEKTGQYTDKMTILQIAKMGDDLLMLANAGYKIVTWNGLGFDFDILAEESGLITAIQTLAMSQAHIDMMFHFFCSKGYPLGLDPAAKGLGLPGKPEGVHGGLAPQMWVEGRQDEVIEYVESDVINTLDVYFASLEASFLEEIGIDWIAKSGRPNTWRAKEWLSVPEAMALPEPDTSWMSDPWPRSKFFEWLMATE